MEKEKNSVFPTMDERLECLKGLRAASPANAAAKVIAISEMEPGEILWHRSERNLFADMLQQSGLTVQHYQEWMQALEKLLPEERGGGSRAGALNPEPDFGLTYGYRFTNEMFLLALAFHRSVKDDKRKSRLGSCCRMTLGDYTDAVIDLSYTDDGKLDEEHLKWARAWKRKLVQEYREFMPLADVLEKIIYRYMDGWEMIGYAENIVKSMDACKKELEYRMYMDSQDSMEDEEDYPFPEDEVWEEDEEADAEAEDAEAEEEEEERYFYIPADPAEDDYPFPDDVAWDMAFRASDPCGYYLAQAAEYDYSRPNLMGWMTVTNLAEMFFLKRDIYRMDVFRKMLSENGYSDFRELLEDHASDAKFLEALNAINAAAGMLKALLYDPYHGTGVDDAIGKYHYERRIAE